MPSLRRLIKIILATTSSSLIALYIGFSVLIALQQDRLVFPAPSDYPKLTPAALHWPFEDLHIRVNGIEQIHAWYIPAINPSSRVIVYFHGNAYTIEDALSGEVRSLRETGPTSSRWIIAAMAAVVQCKQMAGVPTRTLAPPCVI